MSRHQRIVLPGQPHHVITRGNNRRRLFSYDGDYLRFLRYLAEALVRTDCRLHAVTLMANHVHMLVTPPTEGALPALVQRASQRYATMRNRDRGASGKLFEQRYFSVPVGDARQLAVTTVYSDVNALRAGLVENALEYGWSTYAIHAGAPSCSRVPLAMWSPSPWYLGLGRDAQERASTYRAVAAEYLARDEMPVDVERMGEIEELSAVQYTRRLERPNRERAI